jgi:hypothetical protein
MPPAVKENEPARPHDVRLLRSTAVLADANRGADPVEKLRRLTHAPETPSDFDSMQAFYAG